MCEKCELIDRKIAQLRSFAGPDLDSLSRATMRAAIESMQAEKAAFKCGIKIKAASVEGIFQFFASRYSRPYPIAKPEILS